MNDLLERLDAGYTRPLFTPVEFAEAAACIRSLLKERDNFRAAYMEWSNKTEWVQETARPGELGKHRADVMRERIALLEMELKMLIEDVIEDDQEPVAWMHEFEGLSYEKSYRASVPLYTHPTRHLSDEEIIRIAREAVEDFVWSEGCGFENGVLKSEAIAFARAVLEKAK